MTAVLSAAGLIASLCHLGHPFEAFKALYNLGASSLAWEAVGFSCFTLLALITWRRPGRGFALCTALVGAFSLITQGLTYAPPAIPALNNGLPMAIFWLSALALGGSAITLTLAKEFSQAARLAMLALIIVLLLGPVIWISGSLAMIESAILWLKSACFWIGMLLVCLAFVATWFNQGGKIWRFASLFCGIFLTRMVFFADSAHTAANLGLPFN